MLLLSLIFQRPGLCSQREEFLNRQTDYPRNQYSRRSSSHAFAAEAVESTPADTFTDGPGEPEFDDGDIVAPSAPPVPKTVRKKVKKARRDESAPAKATNETSWLGQNKENLLLGMLVLYVFLLGLGTMGELFEIEWILNLPLFR